MISTVLNAIDGGVKVVRLNTKLFLVVILLFVFPAFFVWVTQGFFATSFANVKTTEKQNVSLIHDSIGTLILTTDDYDELLPSIIEGYVLNTETLDKLRVLVEKESALYVLYANESEKIGDIVENPSSFKLSETLGIQILPLIVDGTRTWQSFSYVETESSKYYIFAETSYAEFDSLMKARQQKSYMGLTAIFIFMIALAYWLNKQIVWEKRSYKLEKQLEDRDLFANMIAHEFRAPLTAIKGYASFLVESEAISNNERRFSENILSSAERLVELVNDFLEVARLQSGKLKVVKEDTEITKIITKVVSDLEPLADKKNLKLVFPDPEKEVFLTTDKNRLTQIFTNVISNAIKYTNEGEVELECKAIPGEVIVRVKDTGMGISAQDQQKLFAPFTRVGGVDTTKITGSGLGMWITRQLVEMLGGEIGVESIKGVGTHIVISFKTK